MFKNAIVKKPCRNMTRGLTSAGLGTPDYDLALEQHAVYVTALAQCGLDVLVLEADENFPDSTFIEDTCLVTSRCAIITNPGAPSRKGEIKAVEKAVETIGLPLEHITESGTLDAGDVMMAGDHFFVGLSDRTNKEGASQLATILNQYGFTASSVPLNEVLHLKTGISYLENNTLLATGEFLTKDDFKDFRILEVSKDEAYAANSVWINGTVLVPAGNLKTLEMIQRSGYQTLELDMSEFRKLDGGLSCLSLRF